VKSVPKGTILNHLTPRGLAYWFMGLGLVIITFLFEDKDS
jgi:hypothetical protein